MPCGAGRRGRESRWAQRETGAMTVGPRGKEEDCEGLFRRPRSFWSPLPLMSFKPDDRLGL